MKSNLTAAEREFLNQVSARLTCTRREKQEVLRRVEEILADIPQEEKQTLEQIVQLVDTPEAVAEAFAPRHDPRELQRKKRLRMAIISVGVLLILAVLVGISIFAGNTWAANHKYDIEIVGPAIEGSEPETPSGAIEIYAD